MEEVSQNYQWHPATKTQAAQLNNGMRVWVKPIAQASQIHLLASVPFGLIHVDECDLPIAQMAQRLWQQRLELALLLDESTTAEITILRHFSRLTITTGANNNISQLFHSLFTALPPLAQPPQVKGLLTLEGHYTQQVDRSWNSIREMTKLEDRTPENIYTPSPYHTPISDEQIDATSYTACRQLLDRWLHDSPPPSVVVAGPVNHESITRNLANLFHTHQFGAVPPALFTNPTPIAERVRHIDLPANDPSGKIQLVYLSRFGRSIEERGCMYTIIQSLHTGLLGLQIDPDIKHTFVPTSTENCRWHSKVMITVDFEDGRQVKKTLEKIQEHIRIWRNFAHFDTPNLQATCLVQMNNFLQQHSNPAVIIHTLNAAQRLEQTPDSIAEAAIQIGSLTKQRIQEIANTIFGNEIFQLTQYRPEKARIEVVEQDPVPVECERDVAEER